MSDEAALRAVPSAARTNAPPAKPRSVHSTRVAPAPPPACSASVIKAHYYGMEKRDNGKVSGGPHT